MPTALTRTTTLVYSAGSIGAGAFFAFNNFVLPQLLKAAGASDLLTGLLSSTRSIEGAIIQPAVGALSDRMRTRLGRRRPFIALGIPLSAAFFLFAATQHDVFGLTIGIVLFSIFFNAAADPYVALLADITILGGRGILQGVATAIQLGSQVAFLLLISIAAGAGGIPAWSYLLVAVLLIVTFGITVAGVREPDMVDVAEQRLGLRRYLAELIGHRQAMGYLGATFVFMVGFSAVLPYLTLFITVDIGQTEQVALALAAGTLLVTAVAAVAFGKLADRVGTKPVLVTGWTLLAVAACGGIVIQRLPETIAVVLLAGIGNGAATAAGWPLLASLVPPEKSGVFAGLKAAAESIAIPASVVVAAELFIPRFSYRGVFVLLAGAILVALVILVRFVRPPRHPLPLLVSVRAQRQ
ncbi:MAG TPA: MFS transporter [Candidatus Limnocylindria bacterium]|nr:MFS transporter [Candidatus Limnocylindria bacterium]